jgi:N-acetylglutamate synthase-like GNAT family acetyltransferase
MAYELVDVQDPADWVAYHAIRRQELFEARGRHGLYDENYPGEYEPNMHHLMLKLDGRPIGTTRLDVREDGTAIFRLVAISADVQRQGHGRVLADLVEERARRHGTHTLFVNANRGAYGFYCAMGWHDYTWDAVELTGISADAIQMRKHLA